MVDQTDNAEETKRHPRGTLLSSATRRDPGVIDKTRRDQPCVARICAAINRMSVRVLSGEAIADPFRQGRSLPPECLLDIRLLDALLSS